MQNPDYRVDVVVNQELKDLVRTKGACGDGLSVLPQVSQEVYDGLESHFEADFHNTDKGAAINLKRSEEGRELNLTTINDVLNPLRVKYEAVDFVIKDMNEEL